MTVAHMLTEKGSSVVTVRPERTLEEAIHLLAEKRIGALVVTDEARTLVGIISERDIMRALAYQGAAALDAPISHHMTSDVVTCRRETTNDQHHAADDGWPLPPHPCVRQRQARRPGLDRRRGQAPSCHSGSRAAGPARVHQQHVTEHSMLLSHPLKQQYGSLRRSRRWHPV
jgi:hypothetical protein